MLLTGMGFRVSSRTRIWCQLFEWMDLVACISQGLGYGAGPRLPRGLDGQYNDVQLGREVREFLRHVGIEAVILSILRRRSFPIDARFFLTCAAMHNATPHPPTLQSLLYDAEVVSRA